MLTKLDLRQQKEERSMDIKYQYLCDTAYFKVVIDRQYQQRPWLLRGHETNACTSCTNIGFREHVQTLVSAGSTDAEIWRHWDSDAGLREAFAFDGQLACGQQLNSNDRNRPTAAGGHCPVSGNLALNAWYVSAAMRSPRWIVSHGVAICRSHALHTARPRFGCVFRSH
jgi:hypothetical protein